MPDGKITFAQAARSLGVHVNSVKNWNAAGKLASAEKIQVKGVDKWVVNLEEARQLHQAGHTSIHNNIDNNQIYNGPTTDTQQLVVHPQPASDQQALLLMTQSFNRLLETVDRQTAYIEELSHKNGELQARVAMLEAAQTAQEAPQSPVASEPIQHTQQPPQQPQKPPSLLQRVLRGWW